MGHTDRAALIAWVDFELACAKTTLARARTKVPKMRAQSYVEYWTALAALLEAEAWQPIATAPKMRKVMAFYVNELGKKRTVLACYYTKHALEMDDDYADVGEYDEVSGISYAPEGWYEEHENDSPTMPISGTLTHWRPLPAPPVTEAKP